MPTRILSIAVIKLAIEVNRVNDFRLMSSRSFTDRKLSTIKRATKRECYYSTDGCAKLYAKLM